MLNKALDIAYKAHLGQTDKAGAPYILHPMRVALHCQTEDEKIVALLHDVVEDTPITLEELKAQGFSDDVLAALKCLTKIKGEDYQIFIQRVATNPLAVKVKIQDLTYIIHSGFISGYQNRYGDNLKPPTNVYHRMTA